MTIGEFIGHTIFRGSETALHGLSFARKGSGGRRGKPELADGRRERQSSGTKGDGSKKSEPKNRKAPKTALARANHKRTHR